MSQLNELDPLTWNLSKAARFDPNTPTFLRRILLGSLQLDNLNLLFPAANYPSSELAAAERKRPIFHKLSLNPPFSRSKLAFLTRRRCRHLLPRNFEFPCQIQHQLPPWAFWVVLGAKFELLAPTGAWKRRSKRPAAFRTANQSNRGRCPQAVFQAVRTAAPSAARAKKRNCLALAGGKTDNQRYFAALATERNRTRSGSRLKFIFFAITHFT